MSWVFAIVVIRPTNQHNSDFFLSKKKTTSGPRQLGPVCSDLLHKNKFGSFSFFLTYETLFAKKAKRFSAFLSEKTGDLVVKGAKSKVQRTFFSPFSTETKRFLEKRY